MNNNHFDFIIVGGGSAGCVLAARLSEISSFTVLLVEAGGSGDGTLVNMPAGAVTMVPTQYNNWAFETIEQASLNNRHGYQPRGKCLGGSSAINAMIYSRGHQQDYDDWKELGWGWDTVLPYFIKSENNQMCSGHKSSSLYDKALHGANGPLFVSNSFSNHPIANDFIKAGVDLGYPENHDFNGSEQEGVGRYQVTQLNGQRYSAARAYLEPVRYRQNLTVCTNTEVSKLIVKDKVCTGIVTTSGKKLFANKEVILSAGAIKSPQILLLSGIGDAQHLNHLGITVQVDLPGVGQNLQDHPDYVSCFKSFDASLYGLSVSGSINMLKQTYWYFRHNKGLLTSNFAETGGFLKTSKNLERPDIQFHFVVATVKDHARDWRTSLNHGFSNHICVLRPKSVGTVTLVSSNPKNAPAIDPNFLSHEDDVQTLLKGIRISNSIIQHPFMSKHWHKAINEDQNLTDDELISKIKQLTDSVYHPIGTCKMANDNDPLGVVSPSLKVRHVKGLRVVDASIFPNLIGGNTNAPTIMVAERAADFIKADYP